MVELNEGQLVCLADNLYDLYLADGAEISGVEIHRVELYNGHYKVWFSYENKKNELRQDRLEVIFGCETNRIVDFEEVRHHEV